MSPERWLVVSVHAPSGAVSASLSEGLLALGGSAVLETDNVLSTYLPPPQDVANWLKEARVVLTRAAGTEDLHIEHRWQQNEDWNETWKRGLRPRRVGRHFVVTPGWLQPQLEPGDKLIVIDPEMAFGTGEHATTRSALRFIEMCVHPGSRVLDVGTGSAILAIAAAQLGAGRVLAVDSDADAILNARDNVRRNNVQHSIELEAALVDGAYLQKLGAAGIDVIAANILSNVIRPLLPEFYATLRPNGCLIAGGILEHEAEALTEAAHAAGFTLLVEDLEEEWWGGLLRRAG